ncbi:GumC family protein [Sedimentitalea arenosa]|jgi:polysaccharide chain length determinant protein (PEP-CTERM system associated)|uniref:Lipopolysaccharide biosynthesis n=1 Tax=Sedimentitalea arenosa TaxID=2798803 RepID=A0A8J7JHT9_9RHOB|nr:lipopolysaccharide biosynthesis [Arenibacterium arenosum]MBJ6372514.1 lipopolysaccharide biosynthesis [Arenibacterium arenosum]
MSSIGYYFSLFIRRLPAFLIVAASVATVAIFVAFTLPPAYESRMVLIVEAPQIPDALAPSTVRMPGPQRLQIIEQRLLTRANLLDIARRLDVLEGQRDMSADQIVDAMRARTRVSKTNRANEASIMTISFEARTPRLAAGVLNEYLTLIQADDANFRRARAGQTLDFFEQEVSRLKTQLETQADRILEFKNANAGALPDTLMFRQQQKAQREQRLEEIGREIFTLQSQREQLITMFNEFGGSDGTVTLTDDQKRLVEAEAELENALLIYSETNPRVKLLKGRVEQLRTIAASSEENTDSQDGRGTANAGFQIQLGNIETRLALLERQEQSLQQEIDRLQETIDKTANNAVILEDLERDYENTLNQYNPAVQRLADADTGERIELLSRGERISVIEQPAVPSEPTKPNRMKIAAGGTALGIAMGMALVGAMVFLNSAPRRPEDLIRKLEVWPIATLPYVRTRRELIVQRSIKLGIILIILVGIPLVVFAVHTYYQPLDLIADRVMNKLGVRW